MHLINLMPWHICNADCKKKNFPIKPLYTYKPAKSVKGNLYYKRVAAFRFKDRYYRAGLLKCERCVYITAEPIDRVREILGPKPRLLCPCCKGAFRRKKIKH